MWIGVDTPAESWRLENLSPPAKPYTQFGEGLVFWLCVAGLMFGVSGLEFRVFTFAVRSQRFVCTARTRRLVRRGIGAASRSLEFRDFGF